MGVLFTTQAEKATGVFTSRKRKRRAGHPSLTLPARLDLQDAGLEWPALIVPQGYRERRQQPGARLGRFDDRIDPQAGGSVADVGLLVIARLHGTAKLREFLFVRLVPGPAQGGNRDIDQRAGRLVAA